MFREAAKLYLREFDIITQGQRSPTYAGGQHACTNGHPIPFFDNPEITAGNVMSIESDGSKRAGLYAAATGA